MITEPHFTGAVPARTHDHPPVVRRTEHRRAFVALPVVLGLVVAIPTAGCSRDPGTDSPPPPGIVLSTSPGTDTSAATPGPSSRSPADPDGAERVAPVVLDAEAELEVEDQSGDGNTVRIHEAAVTATRAHVAVVSQQSQEILGVVLVDPGEHSPVIRLDHPLDVSQNLTVMLYADDGDRRFDPAADGRIVDDDGEAIVDYLYYRLS